MGDTFPPFVICHDVRLRYHTIRNLPSALYMMQEVGRVFGYDRPRPCLISSMNRSFIEEAIGSQKKPPTNFVSQLLAAVHLRCVLLSAAPQCGKTGVVLCFLHGLITRGGGLQLVAPPAALPSSVQPPSRRTDPGDDEEDL